VFARRIATHVCNAFASGSQRGRRAESHSEVELLREMWQD